MFAGEFATGTRHGSGVYAVTHRTKFMTQKFIELSEKVQNWFHDRSLRNVIFMVKGCGLKLNFPLR
ncbi:MAG: hypothetical protein HFACDABA_00657 [Anaerolineales bacterium]|nr:hypothetical protein [Anaerolineales bacterium]